MPYLNFPIMMILLVSIAACSPPSNEVTNLPSVSEADERTALAEASGLFQPGVVKELLDC